MTGPTSTPPTAYNVTIYYTDGTSETFYGLLGEGTNVPQPPDTGRWWRFAAATEANGTPSSQSINLDHVRRTDVVAA